MLYGFIGSPGSGKTTIAAKVFAYFKEMGLPIEFLVEEARRYIAELREQDKLSVLTDFDQSLIYARQLGHENTMLSGKNIVLADSSSFNTALYVESPELLDQMAQSIKRYKVLFLCMPVPQFVENDPNRVHDQIESLAIHDKAVSILDALKIPIKEPEHELRLEPNGNVYVLRGNSHTRMLNAIKVISYAHFGNPNDIKTGID